MGVDLRIVVRRLRAEGAVLGAIARLGAYDGTKKYPVALVFKRNFPGKGNEIRQIVTGELV
jgi:uncharacterized membrane protein